MSRHTVIVIRQAKVEYLDLCQHTNISREEFFNESDLKRLLIFGLVLESEDMVKVLYNDDQDDNTECEGIVIPRACVLSITYLEDDHDIEFIPGKKGDEIN